MPAILHQLVVLSCPRAKRFVTEADIRLLWPLWQTEIRKHARLWFHPLAEGRHLTALGIHGFEEM